MDGILAFLPPLLSLFRKGSGGIPDNGLLGMCRWMGSHFHDLTDCNGVVFSNLLISARPQRQTNVRGCRIFCIVSFSQGFSKEILKWGRTFSGFKSKNVICPRVTKMGVYCWSQNRPEINYNWVGVLTGISSHLTGQLVRTQTLPSGPILDRYQTDTWPILDRYLTDT